MIERVRRNRETYALWSLSGAASRAAGCPHSLTRRLHSARPTPDQDVSPAGVMLSGRRLVIEKRHGRHNRFRLHKLAADGLCGVRKSVS